MKVAHQLAELLYKPAPDPPHGFLDDLPEAFGAVDERGEVYVIGYKGEWFVPVKTSLRVRLRNWLVSR
ncbi:MAG: hypothetical protein CMK98_13795 [Pseudomonas sp.]|nr:hypothetical protein [Pseudomonas sp.]|tara:strand:- start:696 stop:899 length:204 start_codon:yes stop_codon:yes gene_type:complete